MVRGTDKAGVRDTVKDVDMAGPVREIFNTVYRRSFMGA